MTDQANAQTVKKPGLLRVIFILNALLVIAGFVFYFVFSGKAERGEGTFGLDPIMLLYMALIYTGVFIGVVTSILKKNIWAMRGLLVVTLVASIVLVFAPIGVGISVISLALSFTKPVTHYFAN